jgi:GTP-binding protein
VQKNGSWISQQFMVLNNWMSDHWENVTDNGSIIDMVIENVPAPKVSEGTPQMLIIFRFLSIYRSYRYWSFRKRCFKRRNANLISKRDGTISKSRIKELHF